MPRSERPGGRLYAGGVIFRGIPPVLCHSTIATHGRPFSFSSTSYSGAGIPKITPRQEVARPIGRYGPTQHVNGTWGTVGRPTKTPRCRLRRVRARLGGER